jgi:hypothetical protein
MLMKILLSLLTIAPVFAATTEDLYGTWRLVSARSTLLATGEQIAIFGEQPQGVLQYTCDGRVTVLVIAAPRPKPTDLSKVTDAERAELLRTMAAYSGTFTFDGKVVTPALDLSWNETWTGTKQLRHARFEGNRLQLASNPQPRALDGKPAVNVLVWERADPTVGSQRPTP